MNDVPSDSPPHLDRHDLPAEPARHPLWRAAAGRDTVRSEWLAAWSAELRSDEAWFESFYGPAWRGAHSLALGAADVARAVAVARELVEGDPAATRPTITAHLDRALASFAGLDDTREKLPEQRANELDEDCFLAYARALGETGSVGAEARIQLLLALQATPQWAHEPDPRARPTGPIVLPILFAGQNGKGTMGALALEVIEIPWLGSSTPTPIVPDPVRLGTRAIGADFARSIADALRWLERRRGRFDPRRAVRWWIDGIDKTTAIDGDSAGAVFAAAFAHLRAGTRPNPHTAITASLDPDTGELYWVGGVRQKLAHAMNAARPVRRFIVSTRQRGATPATRPQDEVDGIRADLGVPVIDVQTRAGDDTDDDMDRALVAMQRDYDSIIAFFERLGPGEAGLGKRHLQMLPDGIRPGNTADFCLDPMVEPIADGDDGEHPDRGAATPDAGLHEHQRDVSPRRLSAHWPRGATASPHLVVKGEPGGGKTTALWLAFTSRARAVLDAVQRDELDPNAADCIVPLGLPLGAYRDLQGETVHGGRRGVLDLAIDYTLGLAYPGGVDESPPERLRQWLVEKAKKREVELYLDALDELDRGEVVGASSPARERLEEDLEACTTVRLLLTSRETTDDEALGLVDPERLRMTLLSAEAVEVYVERSFGVTVDAKQREKAPLLLDRLRQNPGPRWLARVPLLLALLCQATRSRTREALGRLPKTRTGLVAFGVDEMFERGAKRRMNAPETDDLRLLKRLDRPMRVVKRRLLEHIAWRWQRLGPAPIDESALDDLLFEILDGVMDDPALKLQPNHVQELRSVDRAAWIQCLQEDGFLVRTYPGEFRIILRTIHEYFAACYLARTLPQDEATCRAQLEATAGDWPHTPWADEPDPFEGTTPLLAPAWGQNLWIFVAGEIAEATEPRMRGVLAALAARVDQSDTRNAATGLAVRMLGELEAPDDVIQPWIDRGRALLAEDEISTFGDDERTPVVHALAACGHPKAVELLITLIGREDGTALAATRAVAGTYDPDLLDGMHRRAGTVLEPFDWQTWNNASNWLPAESLEALRGVRGTETEQHLRRILTDPTLDRDRRERAAELLGAARLPLPFVGDGDHARRASAEVRRVARPPTAAADEVDLEQWNRDARVEMSKLIEADSFAEVAPDDCGNRRGLPEYRCQATGVIFVLIEGGAFLMGSPPDEPGRFAREQQHQVTLPPFLLARYALSQRVYDGDRNPTRDQADDAPAAVVCWEDAASFCERHGWLLPTEAQWEYACRAGTAGPFAFGESLDGHANFGESSGGVVAIGRFEPNEWGLFQMHGNVWEWCHDVFAADFYQRPEALYADPLCLRGSTDRVLRGGCYWLDARYCRSAYRGGTHPLDRVRIYGFRPARPLRSSL